LRQRGLKSSEALLAEVTAIPRRPDPSADLSPEQAEVWQAYVTDMPAFGLGVVVPHTFETIPCRRIHSRSVGVC
jgi:hypothetical protein